MESLNASMQDNILRLRAQKDLLQDPVYQQSVKQAATLRDEVNALTKSTTGHGDALKAADAAEKGIFSNMRTRREALVMAHEAMMGRTKNLMGSAMVFAEYADLSIMHTITSMINPTTLAIGAVTVATIGATVALYEMTEKAAEHWHAMSLIAEETGTTTEQMIAFEHAAIGTGVSTKTLATAFERFTLNLGKHREELERVGVTAKDPIQAFEQLMDVARRTSDPIERNRILSDALGGSWRQLAPLVMKGGDALRDAIAEMKIPEDVKADYEKINALEIASAKNWDLIKQRSGGAMSSVSLAIKEMKAGFMDLAAHGEFWKTFDQKGWFAFGEAFARGKKIAAAGAIHEASGSTSPSGSSHEDLDAVAELNEKNKKEIRKNSLADALRDEQKAYQEEIALLKRTNSSTEDEERAHQMRISEIKESFAKKSHHKVDISDSQLDGIRAMIAEKTAENDIRKQMDDAGIAQEVQSAIVSKDKEIAAAKEKYRKLAEAKGISKEQIKQLQALENAEIFEIVRKGNAAVLKASDDADEKEEKKASAKMAKDVAAINKAAAARARTWEQEEKLTTKMAGYWQSYYLEVEEMRKKDEERIQGYYLSIATASSSVLSNALLSEQNFFDATVEGFRNMLKQMLAELAANAAIFGVLNVFSGGTASAFAGGLGGLSGLVLNSFDVGTRSLPSDGPIYAHKEEAIFPAPVSRAMNAGDWGPAMRFMGQSSSSTTTSSTTIGAVHIHMPAKANITADDIARELPRALTKVVPRKRSGGSI